VDFEADSCLVIHNIQEFAERLNRAMLAELAFLPGMIASDVKYYDPFATDEFIHDVLRPGSQLFFWKHFRFSYQAEYRFVLPAPSDRIIAPIDVCLGPLMDISDLLIVGST
jgi:hypothetical protein